MRERSYSYSPSPPRPHRRRGRSPSPRGRYGGRGRDVPTSLLVRNLRHDCRPEDLRKHFGQFGPLKDIYLPRDYYTGEPRGFGFVQYVDAADAADAKYHMDGQILLGRELTVVFAEENRKKPSDMRARQRPRGQGSRRSRSRSPRYSRSPRNGRSRTHSQSYHSPSPRRSYHSPSPRQSYHSPSPKHQEHSRSASPQDQKHERERSFSRSLPRSPAYSGSRSRSPEDYQRKRLHRKRSLSVSK